MKSYPFVATLLCSLIAGSPYVLAQAPAPPATPEPADTRPRLDAPDAPSKKVAPAADPLKNAEVEPARPAATGQMARNSQAELQLKLFTLLHIKAVDAERTISQLFLPDLTSLVADQRSNTRIVRGAIERLAEIEALLLRLDTPAPKNADPYGGPGVPAVPAGAIIQIPIRPGAVNYPREMGLPGAPGTDRSNTFDPRAVAPGKIAQAKNEGVEPLRRHYNELDARCTAIARQLRELDGQGRKQDRPLQRRKKLGSELHSAVSDAFQARQQLQRAELAAFHLRMRQTSESIELRERIADQIIKRRVEDLLNPNRRWTNTPKTVEPSKLGKNTPPPNPDALDGGTPSLAERVKADVAKREKTRTQFQGKWVLARTKNGSKPQTLVIQSNVLHFFDAGSKVARTATVRLDTPRDGDIVVQFGKGFPRSTTWMGFFEVASDQLTIRFNSLSLSGASSDVSMADEEDALWHWSGVYQRTTTDSVNASSDTEAVTPFAQALQSVLVILRGADSKQAHLARAYFDDEWTDDIARILACEGHEQLTVAQAWLWEESVFVITSTVINDDGKNMIGELLFKRQADGTWKLKLIDVEPADNTKRDIDRFRKEYPDATLMKIPPSFGE